MGSLETMEGMDSQTARLLASKGITTMESLADLDKAGLKAMGFGAYLAAILRKGPRNYVWALAVASTVPREWTNADLALLEEAAERVWVAMDRAVKAGARNSASDQSHIDAIHDHLTAAHSHAVARTGRPKTRRK